MHSASLTGMRDINTVAAAQLSRRVIAIGACVPTQSKHPRQAIRRMASVSTGAACSTCNKPKELSPYVFWSFLSSLSFGFAA